MGTIVTVSRPCCNASLMKYLEVSSVKFLQSAWPAMEGRKVRYEGGHQVDLTKEKGQKLENQR